jgi:integrase
MQYNITYRKKDKGIQYIIQYKDNTGTWKQKAKQGFTKNSDAKAAALEEVKILEKDLKFQSKMSPDYIGISFGEFIDMYIEHIKLYREGNTVLAYDKSYKKFSDLDRKEMRKIGPVDIQKCVDKMVKSGTVSFKTAKLHLSRLKTALNYAIKPLRIIPANPANDIDILKEKGSSEKRALTQEELADLLSKIKSRRYYMISLLAAKCGLRIGEIVGLTWSDIDDKKLILTVRQQWKHLKDGSYGFGELKSENSYRQVPIPHREKDNPNTIDVLAELKKYRNEFPINYDNRIFNVKNVTTLCSALIVVYDKAGYDISVHELRHTYGTNLIANGLDFKTVAQLMGHDVVQTMKTYSHVTDDMMKRATDLINRI